MERQIDEFAVELTRRPVRSLRLTVRPPDSICVTAPDWMAPPEIDAFVRSHADWIRKRRQAIAAQPPPHRWVSGETIRIFGRCYTLRVESREHKNSLWLEGDEAILFVRRASTPEQRGAWMKGWYRQVLEAEVAKLLPELERLTGLSCDSWQVKEMRTRWGTCVIPRRKIWIALGLAEKPPECLRYLLLHELGHFVSRRHDKTFYAFLDCYEPAWREIRERLNQRL